jgi:hypothetical protein
MTVPTPGCASDGRALFGPGEENKMIARLRRRPRGGGEAGCVLAGWAGLALQLLFQKVSESMGNHDSEIVDAGSVD